MPQRLVLISLVKATASFPRRCGSSFLGHLSQKELQTSLSTSLKLHATELRLSESVRATQEEPLETDHWDGPSLRQGVPWPGVLEF